jgi:protein subunit release factor A
METIIIEIRAAEGGTDAKLLIAEQFRAYAAASQRRSL